MSTGDLDSYLDLFRRFSSGSVSALTFESDYLALFKDDTTHRSPAVFDVLNRVFFDVDEYVDDDELRAEVGGLDRAQLRSAVTRALQELTDDRDPAGLS